MTMRNENAAEKKARETQLASAQQKLTQAQSALDRAKQQMTDAKSQREQADAEYRRAAADRRPALTAARQKAQELAARAKDVEQPLTPEKLKSRVTALESYVPFDPVSEKNRLLATLKPAG
jgi:DNA repair exonuclease SbcCD ATPase subunit